MAIGRRKTGSQKQEGLLEDRVIEHADGFYWESKEKGSIGPFATRAEAEDAKLSGGEATEFNAGETLQEAESEMGISDWIDPDTGGPAEDNVPHIEDH